MAMGCSDHNGRTNALGLLLRRHDEPNPVDQQSHDPHEIWDLDGGRYRHSGPSSKWQANMRRYLFHQHETSGLGQYASEQFEAAADGVRKIRLQQVDIVEYVRRFQEP